MLAVRDDELDMGTTSSDVTKGGKLAGKRENSDPVSRP
jgi:hypothetical protein